MNKRVMFSAIKSGSGKTVCTIGILAILKSMGMDVSSVKAGPDYIDPMFHRRVLGMDSANLDTYFCGHEQILNIYDSSHELTVIEGVMGLFDGLGGVKDEGSSYDLAKALKAPIILVIDCKGMARSVVPLIRGFIEYDSSRLIKGVILNRMSPMYYETIKAVIEQELDIRVCGYVPSNESLNIESRHLGLATPDSISGLRADIDKAADLMRQSIDIDSIIQIAQLADDIGTRSGKVADNRPKMVARLAVAKDEAFNFYYSENLRMLEGRGIELVYFSPLRDASIPEDVQGILLGGGYPELYLDELSKNESMKASIRKAYNDGKVIVAECGGYMYLCKEIIAKDGASASMVGLIDTVSSWKGKLVRFGYISIADRTGEWLPEAVKLKGHEFHYYDCDDNGDGLDIVRASSGRGYEGGYITDNLWAAYPHLYYPSCEGFVDALVQKLVSRVNKGE